MARLSFFAFPLCWAIGAHSATCWSGLGNFNQSNWSHCQQVTPKLLMYFSRDGEFLRLGLFAENHTGWSAVGFGGNGGMKGASQVVVRKNDNRWIVEDRHSLDYVTPTLDASQDASLLFAQDGGTAGIEWGVLLPLNSCDEDDYPITDISRWVHWALGSSHTFSQHTSRGQFHTNFISGPEAQPNLTGSQEVDLLMPDVAVVMGEGGSNAKNPYICGIFDMNVFMSDHNSDAKHHVVKISALIDQTSAQYVHHMILFSCSEEQGFNGTHGQIIDNCESMPNGCYALKWPWAVGSTDIVFPANVGLPIGGGTRFYALQMHYYNPQLTTGVIDRSGVRLTVANEERDVDAGVFVIDAGTNQDMRRPLPAGNSNYTLDPMRVPAECTNMWTSNITVVGVVHHAHLLGKKLNIDVSHGSTYLGPLRRERRYDFNHQSLEPPEVPQLKPGDQLVFSCSYDTMRATEETDFGEQTQQEMCFAAMMYYPLQTFTGASLQSLDEQPTGSNQAVECNGQRVIASAPIIPVMACSRVGDLSSSAASTIKAEYGGSASSGKAVMSGSVRHGSVGTAGLALALLAATCAFGARVP